MERNALGTYFRKFNSWAQVRVCPPLDGAEPIHIAKVATTPLSTFGMKLALFSFALSIAIQAAGQVVISPPSLQYDSATSDTAIAVFVASANETSTLYTLDGSDPLTSQNALRVESQDFVHVERSALLRAAAVWWRDGNVSSAEVSESFSVRSGRFGRAILVPYHNAKPAYSGRVTEVDLHTAKYNSIRIHNIFTDLADYYSEGGVGPYERSLNLDNPEAQVFVRDVSDGDPELVGFQRGFSYTSEVDGRVYGIFVPFFNGRDYSGKVVRVSLGPEFRDDTFVHFTTNATGHRILCDNSDPTCLVKVLDLSSVNERLRGFVGGFSHGRFGYLAPFFDGQSVGHIIARVDLEDFSTSGVEVLDLFRSGDDRNGGFFDGFVRGGFGYLVPCRSYAGPWNGTHTTYSADGFSGVHAVYMRSAFAGDHLRTRFHGQLVRFPLATFDTFEVLDLTEIDPDLRGFAGGFTIGPYAFLVPFQREPNVYHGKIPRIHLENFTLIDTLDLQVDVNAELAGFVGGLAYGKYGVLVPYRNARDDVNEYGRDHFGKVVRFDADDFSSDTVKFIDLPTVPRQQIPSRAEPDLRGFVDGFPVGVYVYLVPNFNGVRYGKFVRIDMRDFGEYAQRQREEGEALETITTGNDGIQFVDLGLHDPREVGFSGGFVVT